MKMFILIIKSSTSRSSVNKNVIDWLTDESSVFEEDGIIFNLFYEKQFSNEITMQYLT